MVTHLGPDLQVAMLPINGSRKNRAGSEVQLFHFLYFNDVSHDLPKAKLQVLVLQVPARNPE